MSVVYAGFFRRASAFFLDALLFIFLSSLFMAWLGEHPAQTVLAQEDEGFAFLSVPDVLVALVIMLCWVKLAATPGKFLMNCAVVDARSLEAISYKQAIIRYLSYYLSLLPLGLGFFWMLWDPKKQGFHDKLAKTVVITDYPGHWQDESQKTLQQLLKEVR